MLSMFREAPTSECPKGQVSMRRVLAAFFAAMFGALGVSVTFHFAQLSALGSAAIGVAGVILGIPVLGVLLLLFFTTWADIATAISALKSTKQGGE